MVARWLMPHIANQQQGHAPYTGMYVKLAS